MTPRAGRHRADPADPMVAAYRQLAAEGWECEHGHPAGHLVRPWTSSPACPVCRRTGKGWLTVAHVLADRADLASARLRHPSGQALQDGLR